MRRLPALLVVALAIGTRAQAEDPPSAAPIRAILLETDDPGLRKVYDGIRKGLELAHLPRVGLETLQDSETAFVEYAQRLAARPPPLLFAIGRRAEQRVIEVGIRARRVFVDTCVTAGGREFPAPVRPSSVAAVVRGTTPVSRWKEVVQRMWPAVRPPELPLLDLPLESGSLVPEEAIQSFVAHGSILIRAGERAPAGFIPRDVGASLFLRFGLGERLATWPPAPGRVLLSDDLAHWGRGAVVVVAPDYSLLGRTAAEAGRRLLQETPSETLQFRTGVTEVRVDLGAAAAVGFQPPLGFVASADVVRGPKR